MKVFLTTTKNKLKVGKCYSKAQVKHFSKSSGLAEAISEMTNNKTQLFMCDVEPDGRSEIYTVENVVDLDFILNGEFNISDTYNYICRVLRARDYDSLAEYNKCQKYVSENIADIPDNYLFTFLSSSYVNDNMFKNILNHFLETDKTGEYLSKIDYSFKEELTSKDYQNILDALMINAENGTARINELLNFLHSFNARSMFDYQLDIYKVLDIVEKADRTGELHVLFVEQFKIFNIKDISDRIVSLANESRDGRYCLKLINVISNYKMVDVDLLFNTFLNNIKSESGLQECWSILSNIIPILKQSTIDKLLNMAIDLKSSYVLRALISAGSIYKFDCIDKVDIFKKSIDIFSIYWISDVLKYNDSQLINSYVEYLQTLDKITLEKLSCEMKEEFRDSTVDEIKSIIKTLNPNSDIVVLLELLN